MDRTSKMQRARFRFKSGTYMLQTARARFNQYDVDPTCLLCCNEQENIEPFCLRCESLNKIRQPFLDKILKLIQNSLDVVDDLNISDTEFTAILLDSTMLTATPGSIPA